MLKLNENFSLITQLDGSILKELNVDVDTIKGALKQRIKGLKNKYWSEFFSNYDVINKKLTKGSRSAMLKRLHEHTQVEFTEQNAYAITGWCVKNANKYFDSQLVCMMEYITGEANTILYKSNDRCSI